MSRYRLKKFTAAHWWGIWDDVDNTWHEGDYADAVYPAGICAWKREKDAQRVLDGMEPECGHTEHAVRGSGFVGRTLADEWEGCGV